MPHLLPVQNFQKKIRWQSAITCLLNSSLPNPYPTLPAQAVEFFVTQFSSLNLHRSIICFSSSKAYFYTTEIVLSVFK